MQTSKETTIEASKPKKPLRALPLLRATLYALTLHTFTASAQTWQTVDDLQYEAGQSASAKAAAVDPFGNVFVAGYAQTTNTGYHALLQRSSDGGSTWSTADDVWATPGLLDWYLGIASDGAGNLYAVGRGVPAPNAGYHWLVRLSSDHGTIWTTVYNTSPAGPAYNIARGVATDSAGDAFVVGTGIVPGVASNVWLVVKGSSGGTSWSTVDYLAPPGPYASANAVLCHPTAGVFVVGSSNYTVITTNKNGSTSTSYTPYWTVRRSLDGGTTWATVDGTIAGFARAIGADASGNIYVAGQSGQTGSGHWLVRESSNGGNSWTTVDDFYPCVTTTSTSPPYKTQTQCYAASAYGFACDVHGNLFVVGYQSGSSAQPAQWLVRENPGGTGAWQTVDSFQYASGANAYGVAADALGNVFVAGFGTDAIAQHWIVRKN